MKIKIQNYVKYYTPLVQEFIREVEHLEHPDINGMPEPFFPAFGQRYEQSALRLAIIGQDTRGWGDLRKFIADERENPGVQLRDGIDYFTSHPFIEWGPRRQSFWGFAMMFLAALHGQQEWGAMKRGAMSDILDSFAWGNGNAVELYSSTPCKRKVPAKYWEKIRQAGDRFNRFRHVVETLKPHVAVIMYRGIHFPTYFEGYQYEMVSNDGRLTHYHLPEIAVDVFHVPHPGSMNRIEGTDHFCEKLKGLFLQHGLSAAFPEFLNGQRDGEKAMEYLQKNAPRAGGDKDKYECVAWVADELKKRDTFMSVPALCVLLNDHGYRTNYGEEFSGGRGSYRLVSGTYHRMESSGQPERARNVALAFRRPNFEYAYSVE